MSQSKLKELLAKFLKGEEVGKYPTVETRILSVNPLQITDDYKKFIDVSSLEERITEEIGSELGSGYKLILQDWKYVLRRIPNSHEYYFDMMVTKYKVQPDAFKLKPDEDPIKMEDDVEIRFLFEARKRAEIEKMVRGKDAPSRDSDKSPAKISAMKDATTLASTGHSLKPTEEKSQLPVISNEEFQKVMGAKASTAKTEDNRNPKYLDSSFFRKGGIASANTKFSAEELLYITIAELMSVPSFVPHIKRSVIRIIPAIRMRRSLSSDSMDDQRESLARTIRASAERAPRKGIDFEEIHDNLRIGAIKWDQIVFPQAALEFLHSHMDMLERTE
jgi:hypothetical protein